MEVTIERILPGGFGLAHAEGRTIMVALAAPGDRLRVRIDRVKGNVSFASIEEIIESSAERVEPPCPYFGRCGGCDFQQMNYQAQLNAKAEIIRDCLRRLARIEDLPDFQITPAPDPWHYRSRAQWQYDSVRQRLGYFESASRNVCDVAECAVLIPQLQDTLVNLREQMKAGSLPDARDFRAVVGDETVSLSPAIRSTSPTVREGSALPAETAEARDITRTIHGESYHLNAESFFQANDALLPQLIDAAIGEAEGKTALELYCGVGLFTLPLARRFEHVIGVESDTAAAKFARTSLSGAGLANVEISTRDVGVWLDDVKRHDLSRLSETSTAALENEIDLILLDPPRVGAESRVIAGVLGLKPRRISYVSCDPATLARDLKKLIAGGYRLTSISAFDMFPQTHHVETVVQLARTDLA
ncbi:MAG: rRNA (uracil1939-C5)-methyltransferase [Blastocatellia bacterium]|jgi:23S rRNA (uracil1939-C5)-methyltransferase|nr:rRNA (uracil1939-C5)-methyltransferase [Blastocatellia bacterium]